MQWNEAQRRAIESESAAILVSAAAGSGKTAVLVERIKRLVIEKNVPLSEMLIVTFTNAAAAEMRQKIANSLTDELERRDSAFLREQVAGIYRADISTFHAYAMNVIKRYYFKADLPPGLKICDDAQRSLLRGEAADELFAARLEGDYRRFAEFLDCYSGSKNEDSVKESMLFSIYDAVRVRPDAFEWLKEKTEMMSRPGGEILAGGIGREIEEDIGASLMKARGLLALAAELLDRGGAHAYMKYIEADIAGIDAIWEHLGTGCTELLADSVGAFKFKRFAVRKEEDKAPYRLIEDKVGAARDRAKKIMAGIQRLYAERPFSGYIADINETARHAEYLCGLIMDFHTIFTRKKIEKGLMDFADVEHYALRILSDEEAAEEYRRKFRYIFIDEYQDNNIMQETLIGKINKGNNIFMVGDVKQSIYKFRLAEPELFAEKYRAFSEGGRPGCEKIDLNLNYRSKAPVIDAVNSVFACLMSETGAGVAYDENAALKQGSPQGGGGAEGRGVELYVIDDSAPEPDEASGQAPSKAGGVPGAEAASGQAPGGRQDPATAHGNATQQHEASGQAPGGSDAAGSEDLPEEWRMIYDMKKTELEAFAAAEIVKRELYGENGQRRSFFDMKQGKERELRLRDIVILLRSAKSQADIFQRVLEDRGIPAFVSTGEGYFDTLEIEAFMNLLRVIDNRRRDIALLSVMYSPIFGFTTDELMDIRLASPALPYCEALFVYAGGGGAPAADQAADACAPSPDGAEGAPASAPAVDGPSAASAADGPPASAWSPAYASAAGGIPAAAFDAGLAGKCRRLLRQLEGWRESAAYMPLDEFIWMLMKESGYYNYAGALPGGAQRQANLRALADKALDFQSTQLRGLRGFINYAEHLKRSVGTGQVKLVGESEDVLRLMTVHKSKGLEFPVVIVAGLGKRFVAEKSAPAKIHKDIGVGIWWSRPSEGIYKKTLIQNVIERKKEKEDLAEEVRVLYVAFTRAMDRLILLGSMPGGAGRFLEGDAEPEGKSYMQLLMPIMNETDIAVKSLDRAELSAWAGAGSQHGGGQAIERLFMGEGAGDGGPLAAEIARRLSFEYPYKEAAALKSKYSASELVKAAVQAGAQTPGPVAAPAAALPQNMDIPAVPAFMEGERKLSAAARGSAIHKIMELMDFREARTHAEEPGYFADMLRGMVEDGILAPAEAETADLAKLRGFLKSDICRRAAESGSLRKEAPFVFRRVVGGEEVLVQGVIDCFFKEAAGPEAGGGEAFILLDYKSGRLTGGAKAGKSLAERAAERYGHQLGIYSEALEKIHGLPVAEAHLYLLDEGEDVIVKLG